MKLFLLIYLVFSPFIHANTIRLIAVQDCPYTCESKASNKGFVVDIIEYVYNNSGYDFLYQNSATYEEALKKVRSGEYDLMVGVSNYAKKDLIFMKQPLGYKHNVIAVQKYSKWAYTSSTSLNQLRLAAIKELSYSNEIKKYLDQNQQDTSKLILRSGKLARKHNLKALRFDKVTAIIDDRVALRYFIFKKKKPFAFKIAFTSVSEKIGIAFGTKSYRSQKYVNILYNGLKKMKGSQKLQDIMRKYGLSEAYIRPLSASH